MSSDFSDNSSRYPQLKKQLLLIYDRRVNKFLWQVTPTGAPQLQLVLLPDHIGEEAVIRQIRQLGLVRDEERVKFKGILQYLIEQCKERAPADFRILHHNHVLLAQSCARTPIKLHPSPGSKRKGCHDEGGDEFRGEEQPS